MISLLTFYAMIALNIKGIGPKRLVKLFDRTFTSSLQDAELKDIFSCSLNRKVELAEFYEAKLKATKEIEDCQSLGINIISYLDASFPIHLRESKFNPGLIYVKGNIYLLSKRKIAVIGTRNPTDHGGFISYRIAKYLSKQNICVVSGLALGCDSEAHKASISEDGSTIAVLGHGLDFIYPDKNKQLAQKILENNGCLLSIYPLRKRPDIYTFAMRDNIQAGLSEKLVLVQSSISGGSLLAANAILQDGRKLVVVAPTTYDVMNNTEAVQGNISIILEKKYVNVTNYELSKKKYVFHNNLDKIFVLSSKNEYDSILL